MNHLPRTRSDHHPLLVNQLQGKTSQRFKGFYFLEAWIQHGDFRRAVEECWDPGDESMKGIMEKFKQGIMGWNRQTFGNISQKKKICKTRLHGIHRALHNHPHKAFTKLESKLMAEMNEILTQEESFRKQKARIKWTTQGERNTKYFHASMITKRRRNKITQLKNQANRWSIDE